MKRKKVTRAMKIANQQEGKRQAEYYADPEESFVKMGRAYEEHANTGELASDPPTVVVADASIAISRALAELLRLSNAGSESVIITPDFHIVNPHFWCSNVPTDPDYSSTIRLAVYNQPKQTLFILFKDRGNPELGRLYKYDKDHNDNPKPFSPVMWRMFVEAQSKGVFFHNYIKPDWKGDRLG